MNLITFLPSGMLHICDRFRGDEDFFDDKIHSIDEYDFLSLKQYQSLVKFISFLTPMYIERGCDRCIYEDVCLFSCPTISCKREGRPFIPESTCKLTKLIYNYIQDNFERILDFYFRRYDKFIYTHEHSPLFLKRFFYKNYNFSIKDGGIEISIRNV